MNWLLVALVILAAGRAVTGSGRVLPRKGSASPGRLMKTGREGIRLLLERIEREEAPEFVMGAMCYGPAAFPERAEYICPVCGERTLYGHPQAQLIEWELPQMRRMVESLQGNGFFQVSLEESFCGLCHPGQSIPGLTLVLVYEQGDTVRSQVHIDDLRLLEAVVRGGLMHTTGNDSMAPLKDRLDRLRTILGVR